jgi:hypothetical protein
MYSPHWTRQLITHTHITQNYDIDVPLFLPIYAHGRLSDLRAIAATKTLGQINFNSGWEWYAKREKIDRFLAPKCNHLLIF